MNLTKILIGDGLLIILAFILFTLFREKIGKQFFLGKFNSFNSKDERFEKSPDLEELLLLETFAKKSGSGIELDSIIGSWKFLSVWKKETDQEDSLSSSLLRLFSARLEVRKIESSGSFPSLSIENSIEFGSLSIRFVGFGGLRGDQPLLPFFFEFIELKLGSVVLLKRALVVPEQKDMPFFAFIGKAENGEWLSARGRGGGIALWFKEKE